MYHFTFKVGVAVGSIVAVGIAAVVGIAATAFVGCSRSPELAAVSSPCSDPSTVAVVVVAVDTGHRKGSELLE